MPPRSAHRPPALLRAAVLAALLVALAGCAGGATFAPDGPCLADGRAPGSYPALETLLPTTLGGVAPATVDSGRDCSDGALGALRAHDVRELRFAGAVWDQGDGRGATIAVLALPGGALDIRWAEEFYEAGARVARRTERIETSRVMFGALGPVFRLDTLNDLSVQTVVVVPAGDVARVVLVATPVSLSTSQADHEARVQAAVAALFGAPGVTAGPFSLPTAGPSASTP